MAIAEFEDLDFDAFHQRELPERLAAGNGAAVVGAVRRLGSLALRLTGGGAYTYAVESGGIAVSPGDAAADTVIELDQESWEGLVHDYESAPGLLYAGRLRCLRGDRPQQLVGPVDIEAVGQKIGAGRVVSGESLEKPCRCFRGPGRERQVVNRSDA